MNLSEKIQDQFNANSDLRVLFFFDKELEYAEEVKTLENPDIKMIDAEKSHFSLKIKLEHELSKEKVILYFPYGRPSSKEEKRRFILLDIFIANKELLLDDVADFINEFQLLPNQQKLVKTFIQELKFKKHQKVLMKYLTPHTFEEPNIIRGLISSYLEFSTVNDASLCLAKLMVWTLPKYEEKYIQFEKKLQSDDISGMVSKWLFDYFEIVVETITKDDIISAISKLKYNVLTQHLSELKDDDPYSKLRPKEGFTLQRMNSLIVEWENDTKLEKELNDVFSILGKPIKEKKLVDIYDADSSFTFFTDELKYLLLGETLKTVSALPDKTLSLLQNISGSTKHKKELSALIKFIGSTANYFNKLNSIKSYRLDTPADYIHSYVENFSKVDTFYRHTVLAHETLQKLNLPDMISTGSLAKEIHATYDNFLIELNREWLDCMKQFDFKFNDIPVAKQVDFYKDQIAESDQKVVVIISDALRYECGEELLKEMLVDTKGNANITYMMTGVPSVTHWGMTNLLSDKPLTLKDGKLRIEGILTDGTANREKILKINEPSAKAVQYKTLNTLDRDDARKKYFNEKKVVYIYHNVIDAIGDDPKTEMKTFSAINDAIEDLKNLITKVHASFAVGRVLITSDHGFLFNYNTLPAASFQNAPKGNHLKQSNRYILTTDTKSVSNSFQFNLSDSSTIESDLKIVTPKAINRYKRQGSGAHFVHGGASLQEMIIPLIDSTRKRKDIGKKVSFRLMNEELKIVSGALKVKLFQEQPVSSDNKTREIIMGIYNSSDELASSELTYQLDSPSEIATDRMRESILNLDSKSAQESILTLKIFNQEDRDKLNPEITKKIINNTFMEMDF